MIKPENEIHKFRNLKMLYTKKKTEIIIEKLIILLLNDLHQKVIRTTTRVITIYIFFKSVCFLLLILRGRLRADILYLFYFVFLKITFEISSCNRTQHVVTTLSPKCKKKDQSCSMGRKLIRRKTGVHDIVFSHN